LTSDKTPKVFIVDDSLYNRNRSKKVVLLSRIHSHNENHFYCGFRLLTLGWSDGTTCLRFRSPCCVPPRRITGWHPCGPISTSGPTASNADVRVSAKLLKCWQNLWLRQRRRALPQITSCLTAGSLFPRPSSVCRKRKYIHLHTQGDEDDLRIPGCPISCTRASARGLAGHKGASCMVTLGTTDDGSAVIAKIVFVSVIAL
jgi:hypothetical protein